MSYQVLTLVSSPASNYHPEPTILSSITPVLMASLLSVVLCQAYPLEHITTCLAKPKSVSVCTAMPSAF
jgi:hypothetical protein